MLSCFFCATMEIENAEFRRHLAVFEPCRGLKSAPCATLKRHKTGTVDQSLLSSCKPFVERLYAKHGEIRHGLAALMEFAIFMTEIWRVSRSNSDGGTPRIPFGRSDPRFLSSPGISRAQFAAVFGTSEFDAR